MVVIGPGNFNLDVYRYPEVPDLLSPVSRMTSLPLQAIDYAAGSHYVPETLKQ